MNRQANNTVLVKSREMTGRSQTLPWCLWEGGVKTTENKKKIDTIGCTPRGGVPRREGKVDDTHKRVNNSILKIEEPVEQWTVVFALIVTKPASQCVWGDATPPPPPTSRFCNNLCKSDSALFSRFLHDLNVRSYWN
jgi:hypothetical protein